jgi:hypothetical protein
MVKHISITVAGLVFFPATIPSLIAAIVYKLMLRRNPSLKQMVASITTIAILEIALAMWGYNSDNKANIPIWLGILAWCMYVIAGYLVLILFKDRRDKEKGFKLRTKRPATSTI